MKLRNKKTGEIIIPTDYTFATYDDGIKYGHHIYYSLAELVEEWEDYKPAEPLIKDEKIRKAVRAWAEANRDVSEVMYAYDTNMAYCEIIDNQSEAKIRFNFLFIKELNTYDLYTIEELCGEEKE